MNAREIFASARPTVGGYHACLAAMHDTEDPWSQLAAWLAERDDAMAASGPSIALATATPDGVPSVRIVGLRGLDDRGVWFFTHAGSRKTRELEDNPAAAAVMHWPALRRQLRLDGVVELLPRVEAERYFATRPRGAQISAVVSRQGQPSPGLASLREAWQVHAFEAADRPIACPETFIGYRLVPHAIEFWEGSDDRLHDRVVYLRRGQGWQVLALQP